MRYAAASHAGTACAYATCVWLPSTARMGSLWQDWMVEKKLAKVAFRMLRKREPFFESSTCNGRGLQTPDPLIRFSRCPEMGFMPRVAHGRQSHTCPSCGQDACMAAMLTPMQGGPCWELAEGRGGQDTLCPRACLAGLPHVREHGTARDGLRTEFNVSN